MNRRNLALKSEARIKRLQDLTTEEQEILWPYYVKKTRTYYYSGHNGIVRGLEKEGILFKVTDEVEGRGYYAFNLEDWAFNLIMELPDNVFGPEIQKRSE